MSIPSAGDLAKLRTQPHRSDIYMSIYKPPTIWAAQVNNGSAAKGDRNITFDNVSVAGTPVQGQTMYVGTTPGGKDKGTTFVTKPISGSVIKVAENSDILWADDDYITVVNFFQIWPVYPRVEMSGSSYIQVYMGFDIAEAYDCSGLTPNEIGISMNCMGSHFAGFRDPATKKCSVTFSDENSSYDGLSSINFYYWALEDASPDNYAHSGTPPGSFSVEWSTPGHYTVSLETVNTNDRHIWSYRHVSIYDRPGEGPNVPILKWGMDSLSGSRDEGGYTASLWVEEDISDIVDGALVVLFADDWYGTEKVSIGGNGVGRESIVFVGYILGDSIKYDYSRSRVNFDVGSPTMVMKKAETFGVSLEDSVDPCGDAATKLGSPWYYVYSLASKRGIYTYLYWYTTAFLCNDIIYQIDYPTYGNYFLTQYYDSDRTTMYDAINTFLRSSLYGSLVCDRQGTMYMEIDASIPTGSSYLVNSMNFDKQDWVGEPTIAERVINELSQLEVGGVAWSGSGAGSVSVPYLSVAPGSTPAYRGTARKVSGFILLDSQAYANYLSGNIFAWENSRYPEVRFSLAGNYRNFDIAPQEWVAVTLHANENHRGIEWVGKKFVIKSMSWRHQGQLFIPEMVLREHTIGSPGDAIPIDGDFTQSP